MGEKCGSSLSIIRPPSMKLRMEVLLTALVAKAKSYDKPPSQQEISEAVKVVRDFLHEEQKKGLDDSSFYAICKAIYCLSYESEVDVGGTLYFWNLKKGLSIIENNGSLWI